MIKKRIQLWENRVSHRFLCKKKKKNERNLNLTYNLLVSRHLIAVKGKRVIREMLFDYSKSMFYLFCTIIYQNIIKLLKLI